MNLLDVMAVISVVLTVLVGFLALTVVALHSLTDRHARRNAEFHERAEPVVRSYLGGLGRLQDAVEILRESPSDALKLLVEISEELGTHENPRLHAVFAAFPFVAQELAGLKSRNREVRLRSAQMLGYLGDEAAVPGLLEVLQDDSLAVRLEAARSLARLEREETFEPVVRALDVPGEMPQRRVAEALVEFGPVAKRPLLALLQEKSLPESALNILVRVSGMLKLSEAAPRLIELLQHSASDVRLNGVRALVALGDRSVIPSLVRLAADPAWEVRNGVMHALGDFRAADQVPLLAERLADRAWWVRLSAAQALYQIGGQGLEALEAAAAYHADRFAHDISRQVLQEHGIHQPPAEARS